MTSPTAPTGRRAGLFRVLTATLAAPLALTLLVAMAPRAGTDGPSKETATITAAVRRVLDDQVAAWNAGDIEGFLAGYWSSPETVFISGGDKTLGFSTVAERFRRRYTGPERSMDTLVFDEIIVRPLTRDTAYAHGRFTLRRGAETTSWGRFTLILREVPGSGWRIVHDHTSGPASG